MARKEEYWKNPEKYKAQRRNQYQKNKVTESKANSERQMKKYHEDESYRENILQGQRDVYKTMTKEDKESLLEENRIRWHKNYQTKYKLNHDLWYKETHKETKQKVMELCGNGKASCVICGMSDIDILTIDHKNGREGNERKTKDTNKNHYGFPFWRKIVSGKLSASDFQTLCMNCNWKKHLNRIKKRL